MAVIQTSAAFYRGNYNPLGSCVGYESGLYTASVARYKFKTDEKGASKLSFETENAYLAHAMAGDEWAADTISALRFIVTKEATGYENYCGDAGESCGYSYNDRLYGETDVELMPNTEYYLWIFPNFIGYAVWGIGGCTVTTEGLYGTASTVTANDGYMGEDIPITLSRLLPEMLHTVWIDCAGARETLIEMSGTYPTVRWTPSKERYAPLITEADRAEAVINAETFLNGNSLGVSQKTILLKIREDELLPVLSEGWYSITPHNTGQAEGFKSCITGYSAAEVSFDEDKIDLSGTLGGSIGGFEIKWSGGTVSESPYRTGILSGQTALSIKLTDSRGRSITESVTLTPLPYSSPALTQINVFRCDENGSESEDGYYYSAKATAVYSALGGENSVVMTTKARSLQGSFGDETAMESGTAAVVGGISPDGSFEIKIEISDELGNSASVTRKLPTRKWAMKFREDAQGLAFGKAPEFIHTVELPENWGIRRGLEDHALWRSDIRIFTATVSTAWTEDEEGVRQTIGVSGLPEGSIVVSLIPASTKEERAAQEEAYGQIYRITNAANQIEVYAEEETETEIELLLLSFPGTSTGGGSGGSNEIYAGSYSIDPLNASQTLETENKLMVDDLTVNAVPYAEVSNSSGGETITIGG